jgi:hypothetical protein
MTLAKEILSALEVRHPKAVDSYRDVAMAVTKEMVQIYGTEGSAFINVIAAEDKPDGTLMWQHSNPVRLLVVTPGAVVVLSRKVGMFDRSDSGGDKQESYWLAHHSNTDLEVGEYVSGSGSVDWRGLTFTWQHPETSEVLGSFNTHWEEGNKAEFSRAGKFLSDIGEYREYMLLNDVNTDNLTNPPRMGYFVSFQ